MCPCQQKPMGCSGCPMAQMGCGSGAGCSDCPCQKTALMGAAAAPPDQIPLNLPMGAVLALVGALAAPKRYRGKVIVGSLVLGAAGTAYNVAMNRRYVQEVIASGGVIR